MMLYFCKDRSLKTGQINNITNIKIRWKIHYRSHSLCPNVKDITKIHRLSSCCSFGRLYSNWQKGVVKGIFLRFLRRKTVQIVFLMLRDLTVSYLAHGIIISPTGASSHFLKAFPPALLEIKLKHLVSSLQNKVNLIYTGTRLVYSYIHFPNCRLSKGMHLELY